MGLVIMINDVNTIDSNGDLIDKDDKKLMCLGIEDKNLLIKIIKGITEKDKIVLGQNKLKTTIDIKDILKIDIKYNEWILLQQSIKQYNDSK